MIVVVTGGRDYADGRTVEDALDTIDVDHRVTNLYHGGCRGADLLADQWARKNGVPVRRWSADWTLGRKAGPIRNGTMLKDAMEWAEMRGTVAVVVAFPGGRGTADCVRQAKALGLTVREFA